MEWRNIKTPQWKNTEHTVLDVVIEMKINNNWETVNFTAREDSEETYVRDIFEVAKKKNPTPYIPPHVPYNIRRVFEYPPIGDQLDAIWKALEQLQTDGADLPPDTKSTLDIIADIKLRHPK